MTLWNKLKRRKVVRVAIAYLIVGWLLIQIADVTLEPLHLPEWSDTLVIWLIALGFPIAVVLAWMLEVTPEGIRVTADESDTTPVDDASIAVMPFVNMSGDSDNEYFSDGMSEELINLLARLRDLRVCSRTSSFALKGNALDMSSIAGKLGVRYVLEGSVRRADNRVRITAQLIDASSDTHLWSETYDREIEDIFAVQDEIAGRIFKELKLTLTAEEETAIQSTTDSFDAFDHYLRGREQYHRTDSGHLDKARQEFKKAIEIDPSYALAWAGLTYVFADTYWYVDKEQAYIDKAHEASRKAVELAPHLAESHAALGLAYRVAEQLDDAEAEFERAIELNPRLFEPIHFYAQMARSQGQYEKAAGLFRRAADVRPNDPRAWILGSTSLGALGEKEEAFKWAEKSIEVSPESSSTAYNFACLLTKYGENERAIDQLENAVRLGGRNKLYYETDVDFDLLRDHPRFKRLMDSI